MKPVNDAPLMTDLIDDNLTLVDAPEEVDQLNSAFYSRFPFPWRPKALDCTSDPDFARVMLNQNLGDWTHQTVPPQPRIWVAGCGTNQAAITALNFPTAAVRGSDISPASLELCGSTARDLGCTNLELRRESINEVGYDQEFDYVICTGVIHHNADPEATLRKLVKALKPTGVLELMVYNRYHRILTSAFQKGVRLLAGTESAVDFQKELSITRALIDDFPVQGLMAQFVGYLKQAPEAQIADALMQPVENSYTVEVLEEMARRCGLEFLTPVPNVFDRGVDHLTWNLHFSQREIQQAYEKLPDSRRWQITNLLMCEASPHLWFYMKRADGPLTRKSEQQICDSFLETRFKPNAVSRRSYVLTKDNKYSQVKSLLPYPGMPAKPDMRRIVEAAAKGAPMRRIFESLRITPDFTTVNNLRVRLTSSAGPFLRSIP
jgi:2-polyprenyl-3-methyl-5-hydroxy-6-metoxy-1,4-benzoquinol methylase